MESNGGEIVNGTKICAYCGNWFNLDGKRYKYCCDECALLAHRERCRENFRRRYAEKHEQELERNRNAYHNNPKRREQQRIAGAKYRAKKAAQS